MYTKPLNIEHIYLTLFYNTKPNDIINLWNTYCGYNGCYNKKIQLVSELEKGKFRFLYSKEAFKKYFHTYYYIDDRKQYISFSELNGDYSESPIDYKVLAQWILDHYLYSFMRDYPHLNKYLKEYKEK